MVVVCRKLVLIYCLLLVACSLPLPAYSQKQLTIAEIQGDKNISPHEGETVSVSGIVTARTKSGFFLQTPNDKIDSNPATSEGIFIFTKTAPSSDIAVGAAVTVSGRVEEYRNRRDGGSLAPTENFHRVGQDVIKVGSNGNALPKTMGLTVPDFA